LDVCPKNLPIAFLRRKTVSVGWKQCEADFPLSLVKGGENKMKSPDVDKKIAVLPKKAETKGFQTSWKYATPVVVMIIIALIPAPAGLPQHAWSTLRCSPP